MANYNLTNQPISSSFQQLLQKNDSDYLVDGTGSVVTDLKVSTSISSSTFYGDGSNLTNVSASLQLPSGVVSGSSQIDLSQASGVAVSSSYAITSSYALNGGVTSIIAGNNITIDQSQGDVTINSTTTASADWNDITNKPSGIVSGSSQIDYAGISNVPSGIVSSSSQVSFNGIADVPSGLVSGSSQIDLGQTFGTASQAVSSSHAEVADLALTSTNSTYAQNTITTGKNLSGGEILKGTPLYFTGSGTSGNIVGVYPADAGNPSRMPAGGIAGETIADGAEGIVLLDGYIGNVNTTGFDSGDKVYVAVGGGYTKTEPTGSALIQFLGNIEKGNSTNGSGVIQMHGEERGLPNLTSGYAWVGDGDGVPQAVATSSFAVSVDTGSLLVTASFDNGTRDLTFTKGDSSTFAVNIPGTSGSIATGVISGSVGNNIIPKGVGDTYLTGSNMTDNGTTTEITNTLNVKNNSGITIENQSGTGQVTITPGPDFVTKFDAARLEGFTNIGADLLSGSLHQIGYTSNDIRIKNLQSDSTSTIDLGFGIGDGEWQIQLVSSSNQTHIRGAVSASSFISASEFVGLIKANNGIISSSEQIINYGNFATTGSNIFTGNQQITGSLSLTETVSTTGVNTSGISTLSGQTDFSGAVNIGNSTQLTLDSGTNFVAGGLPSEANFSARTLWNLPTYTNIGNRGYDQDSGEIKLYGNNTNGDVAGGYTIEFVRSGSLSNTSYFSPLSTTFAINSGTAGPSSQSFIKLADIGGGNTQVSIGSSTVLNIGVDAFPSVQFALNNPSSNIPVDIWGTKGLRVSSSPGNPKPAVHLMPDGSVSASAAISSSGDLIINNINASGTLTASLQEGYVWAGGAGDTTILVATSSFGGGGGGIFEQTGSFYATTNDLQVTGSFGVQGAIGGGSETLSITSLTASVDLTTSNTYELTLVSGSDTHLDVTTFGESGQSINVLVKQPSVGTGSISFSPDFKFGQGYNYVPTPTSDAEDIISFTRFGSFLYGTYINNFS